MTYSESSINYSSKFYVKFYFFIALFFSLKIFVFAQNKSFESLINSGYKMSFPSIYFNNNSSDYASMPYSVDSCYNYIAINMENIKKLYLWKDSSESNEIVDLRIKKIRKDLKKYILWGGRKIKKVNNQQKISNYTIKSNSDSLQKCYLQTINSVLDVYSVIIIPKSKKSHTEKPRWWCRWCWGRGAFLNKYKMWRLKNSKKKKINQNRHFF